MHRVLLVVSEDAAALAFVAARLADAAAFLTIALSCLASPAAFVAAIAARLEAAVSAAAAFALPPFRRRFFASAFLFCRLRFGRVETGMIDAVFAPHGGLVVLNAAKRARIGGKWGR